MTLQLIGFPSWNLTAWVRGMPPTSTPYNIFPCHKNSLRALFTNQSTYTLRRLQIGLNHYKSNQILKKEENSKTFQGKAQWRTNKLKQHFGSVKDRIEPGHIGEDKRSHFCNKPAPNIDH